MFCFCLAMVQPRMVTVFETATGKYIKSSRCSEHVFFFLLIHEGYKDNVFVFFNDRRRNPFTIFFARFLSICIFKPLNELCI